jgi:hypothetical protein
MTNYSPAQITVATQIFNYFSASDKLGQQGGIAAVINAFCESSLKSGAIGDHDAAFGLWQQHSDADTKQSVLAKTGDVIAQCGFLWRDFQTTEHVALGIIKASKTSYDATYNWTLHYERPRAGVVEATRRACMATEWMQRFGVAI